MPKIESLADVDNACREFIAHRKGKENGGVHGTAHARNVGLGSESVGRLYQLPERTLIVARFAGWLHDFKRSAEESAASTDEEASAYTAQEFLEGLNSTNTFANSQDERDAIAYAILNHGKYPDDWKDPRKRNLTPKNLKDQVRILNFVPDKADANGAQVIARRSMFVAGERLSSSTGDLRTYGFRPDSELDQILVVCIESALRLSFINPQEIYPDRLRVFVAPLYDVQRPFVMALLKTVNLDTQGLADLILSSKNPKGQDMFEVRKIDAPKDAKKLAQIFETIGGITNEGIVEIPEKVVNSAVRTLRYFAPRWQGDFDSVVADWIPRNDIEKGWKTQMLEYNEGSWFERITQEIALSSH